MLCQSSSINGAWHFSTFFGSANFQGFLGDSGAFPGFLPYLPPPLHGEKEASLSAPADRPATLPAL